MYSFKLKNFLTNEEELCDGNDTANIGIKQKNLNLNRVPISLKISAKFSPYASKIKLRDVKNLFEYSNNVQNKGCKFI